MGCRFQDTSYRVRVELQVAGYKLQVASPGDLQRVFPVAGYRVGYGSCGWDAGFRMQDTGCRGVQSIDRFTRVGCRLRV